MKNVSVGCTAVAFPSLHMVVAAFANTLRLYTLGADWTLNDTAVSSKGTRTRVVQCYFV